MQNALLFHQKSVTKKCTLNFEKDSFFNILNDNLFLSLLIKLKGEKKTMMYETIKKIDNLRCLIMEQTLKVIHKIL